MPLPVPLCLSESRSAFAYQAPSWLAGSPGRGGGEVVEVSLGAAVRARIAAAVRRQRTARAGN
jgi:hypothetical protein